MITSIGHAESHVGIALTTGNCAFSLLRMVIFGFALAASSMALADVTFVVNTTDDRIDDDTSDGLCQTSVGTCSLRAAIMQTNTLTVPITRINLPAGTFVLTRPPSGSNGDANGDLNLTSALVAGQLVVITGAGAGLSIIDANQIDRVLRIDGIRSVELADLTVTRGYAPYVGGGIWNAGTLQLDGCIVEGNRTLAAGGGIYNAGTLHILRSTIRANLGFLGGGLAVNGPATIKDSTFHDNGASNGSGYGSGGAVQVSGAPLASLHVVNSTFSQNYADHGGGAISSVNDTAIYNSTIFGNDADHNQDENGGVGGGVELSLTSRMVVVNTLIANNTIANASIPDNCNGVLEVYGWNLLDDFIGCTFVGNGAASRGLVSVATIGPLQDNGGPTPTHALLAGSEAIDSTLDSVGCVNEIGAPLLIDQRGAQRPAGLRCDVGAVEYGALIDRVFRNGFE